MFKPIASILTRFQDPLIRDALGAATLSIMLIVGLHLPGLIRPVAAWDLVPDVTHPAVTLMPGTLACPLVPGACLH
ncbi:MAG: hypothetical protein GDA36_09270 [Rhodobacteraceae bacterium]|nr:hypothetical protein [Paracoccaceae bacterium]